LCGHAGTCRLILEMAATNQATTGSTDTPADKPV
jgi:hypothetical protein